MLNNFFSNKRNVAIFILIVLSIFSFVWIFAVTKNNSQPSVPNTTPMSTKFEVVRTIPKSGTISTFPTTTSIEIDFSKSIDVSSLVLNVVPKTNLSFDTNSNNTVLYIQASDGWLTDVDYQITIDVMSTNKEKLPQKINMNFKVVAPTSSQMDEIPTGK